MLNAEYWEPQQIPENCVEGTEELPNYSEPKQW